MNPANLKQTLIKALKNDGFETFENGEKIVALKDDNIFLVKSNFDIEKRVNYSFLISQKFKVLSKIGGIPFSEIKKLIKYEKKNSKSMFDTFLKVCEKYNWSANLYSDFYLDKITQMKYIEVSTDFDSVVTFAFIENGFNEAFLALDTNAHNLLKNINNLKIEHKTIEHLAPSLYQIIKI